MSILKTIFQTFCYVLSGSILCTATFITIFYPDAELNVSLLWQVFLMSFISALGALIYISKKELGKKQMKIRQTFHFIYTLGVVFGIAITCDWIDASKIPELLVMLLMVSGVYFAVCRAMFLWSEKEAESINRRLRKIYPEDEREEQ